MAHRKRKTKKEDRDAPAGSAVSTTVTPRVTTASFNLRKACQDLTGEALDVITGIMRARGEYHRARLTLRFRAAEFIVERGWGLVQPSVGDQPPADEYASSVREATALMNSRTIGDVAQKVKH